MPRPVRLLPLALVLAAAGPPAATAAQQPGDAGRAFRGGVDLVVVGRRSCGTGTATWSGA